MIAGIAGTSSSRRERERKWLVEESDSSDFVVRLFPGILKV